MTLQCDVQSSLIMHRLQPHGGARNLGVARVCADLVDDPSRVRVCQLRLDTALQLLWNFR